jgi:hypothetical protein
MRKMKRLAIYCALASCVTAHASVMRTPVPSIKPLMLEALAHGEAHGVLIGAVQRIFEKNFKSAAPIEVDVKRIGSHRQPGCARLAVTTQQADVVLPVQSGMPLHPPTTMKARYQIDYCETGEFPQGEEGK